jgi:hypothetical protein
MQGSDFFAALTFPVNDLFCTLINGGWGGMLVGLSSLDGNATWVLGMAGSATIQTWHRSRECG